MNNSIAQWIGIVVAIVIAAIGLFGGGSTQVEPQAGGTTAGFEDARQGFKINGTNVLTRSGAVTTVGAGTTNTATTSTNVGGCIQSVATSTATPIKFSLLATTTGLGYNNTVNNGIVAWQYGTCP